MNFNCIICSDIFQPNLEIYTTSCGHIFHHICLIQWLERSKTCPQCRCKATEKTIHRLFFNLTNTEGIADDVATLQSKLDSMHFQIRLKDKDVENYKDKYHKIKEQSLALRGEVKELESKQIAYESTIHALKDQVGFFKTKSKDMEKLKDDVKSLRNKLKNLEEVELVINGTKEQVKEMLRHNRDPNSLSLLVGTLKKELTESERKYRLQSTTLKHLQNDLNMLKRKIRESNEENTKLKNLNESYKSREVEKVSSKKKPVALEMNNLNINLRHDDSDCIVLSSSNPTSSATTSRESTSLANDSDLIVLDSPNKTIDYSKNTKDTNSREPSKPALDSTYTFSIKSSNVGLSCLLSPKFITQAPKKAPQITSSQILKPSKLLLDSKTNSRKADYTYNGLGGHSKDVKFPEPQPGVSGFKRHQPMKSSTNKVRKLAPNKVLTDYLNKNDDDIIE